MLTHSEPGRYGGWTARRRLAVRWFAGLPLHGPRVTDATFRRPATQALVPGQLSRRRDHLPGWRRSAVRQVTLFGPPLVWWQYATHPARTVTAATLAGAAGVAWAVRWYRTVWPLRRHMRGVVDPLHAVLSAELGLPRTTRPDDYLTVPPDYNRPDGSPVTVRTPVGWAPSKTAQDRVSALTLSKLAWGKADADVTWTTRGTPVLMIRQAPKAPDSVAWADIVDAVEASEPGDLVLGKTAHGLYRWNLNGGADPHAVFAVNTGGGKSTTLMVISAQIVADDPAARVSVIDPKMTSFQDLYDTPQIRLANNPMNVEAMWALIAEARSELGRRMAEQTLDPALKGTWPRWLVVIDEATQFHRLSQRHWRQVRDPATDSAVPPVWDHVADLTQMGREYRFHVIFAGQRIEAKTVEGCRDLLAHRAVYAVPPGQLTMMGLPKTLPPGPRHAGRWLYWLIGGDTVWVQNAYAKPGELRAWILARQAMSHELSHDVSHVPVTSEDTGSCDIPEPVEWVVGVEAAAARAGLSPAAFRQRRTRAGGQLPGEGKDGRTPLFDPAVLDAMAAGETVGR